MRDVGGIKLGKWKNPEKRLGFILHGYHSEGTEITRDFCYGNAQHYRLIIYI